MKKKFFLIVCLVIVFSLVFSACSSCDHEWSVTKDGVKATCTTEGLTEEKTCGLCGKIEEQQTIPSLGGQHNVTNGICSVCNDVTDGLAALKWYIKTSSGGNDSYYMIDHKADKNGVKTSTTISYDEDEDKVVFSFSFNQTGGTNNFLMLTYNQNSDHQEVLMSSSSSSGYTVCSGKISKSQANYNDVTIYNFYSNASSSLQSSQVSLMQNMIKLMLIDTYDMFENFTINIKLSDLGFTSF